MNSLGSEVTECRILRETLLFLCPPLSLPLCLLDPGRGWLRSVQDWACLTWRASDWGEGL